MTKYLTEETQESTGATVFMIFDNQYVTMEDAEYIQENHGNPSNRITVDKYDSMMPLFTIQDGEQIEL